MRKLSKKQKLIILISIILIAIIIGIAVSINVIRINIANGKYNTANSNSSSANLLPEYIKEGVTLGGVTGSLVDLDTSDATATPEDIVYGKTAYVDGKKITGTYLTLGMLEIGDYVAYTPDSASNYNLSASYSGYSSDQTISQENLNWRILSINNDGTVDLISDRSTNTNIYLEGSLGYNNGVYVLNEIARKLYSNKQLGTIARSVTIEDIEIGMNESGIESIKSYENEYSDLNVKFEENYTYTENLSYPSLYIMENGAGINTTIIKEDGINVSDNYYDQPTTETYNTASQSLTVMQTFYNIKMQPSFYKNDKFNSLIHTGDRYWLASRFAFPYNETVASWGIRIIDHDFVGGNNLFYSGTGIDIRENALRPLVTFSANMKIISGDGKSPSTAYQIIK